jgi:ketosteroid isomerase-like protein
MSGKRFNTPEEAEAAFYEAFRSIDLERMAAVWSDGDKVLCIHPGSGLLRGRQAVMQSWMEIFSGSEPPIVEFRVVDEFTTGDLAVRLVEERIRPRGKPASAANRVLATNVYLREGGSWRLVDHHASLPLVNREEPGGDDRRLH